MPKNLTRLACALLLCLLPALASAQTYVGEAHNDGITSFNLTYSATAGNELIFDCAVDRFADAAIVSITNNGSGGTAPAQLVIRTAVDGSQTGEDIWGTLNAPTGATTYTVTVTSTRRANCSVIEYSGVGSFGTTTTGGATSTSFTLTSGAAHFVGGYGTIVGNVPTGTVGTVRVNNYINNQGTVYHTAMTGIGGTTTATFTSQRWDGAGVALVAAAGATCTGGMVTLGAGKACEH